MWLVNTRQRGRPRPDCDLLRRKRRNRVAHAQSARIDIRSCLFRSESRITICISREFTRCIIHFLYWFPSYRYVQAYSSSLDNNAYFRLFPPDFAISYVSYHSYIILYDFSV